MVEILLLVLILMVAGSLVLILKAKSTTPTEDSALKAQLSDRDARIVELSVALAAKEAALSGAAAEVVELSTKLEGLGSQQEAMKNQFKVMATEVLKQQSDAMQKSLKDGNKAHLDIILAPFQKHLDNFEKDVKAGYEKNRDERIELKSEIKHLVEANEKITKEAGELARALRGDVKAQGNWGELVLEKLLQASGLTSGIEYTVQESMVGEDGKRYLPDVVINMPDNKHLIIDSKVSMVAYERFINTEDPDEQAVQADALVHSIQAHIKGLSDKSYQNLGDSNLDFVLLYIPIEGAYSVAVQREPSLYQYAFDQNIVLVTNTTLWATMRTVGVLWRQEKQSRNMQAIADGAAKMYDKFVGFTEDMIKVGKQMDTAKGTYGDAMKKLSEGSGNLVHRAEQLKKLGLKNAKQLDAGLVNRAVDDGAVIDEGRPDDANMLD
jgi:DNA recombination protein RmuC